MHSVYGSLPPPCVQQGMYRQSFRPGKSMCILRLRVGVGLPGSPSHIRTCKAGDGTSGETAVLPGLRALSEQCARLLTAAAPEGVLLSALSTFLAFLSLL